MRKLDLIVTGTGRCGTGFVSRLLCGAGVPCGHEQIFSYDGLPAAEMAVDYWCGLIADSSWLAAPFLDCAILEDALLIHVVRHPKKVIESWLRVPTETTPRYQEFLEQHLELNGSPTEHAERRWVEWNKLIESYDRERVLFRIERGPIELLKMLDERGFLNLEDVQYIFNDRRYNHKEGPQHDVALFDTELLEMVERYGYS